MKDKPYQDTVSNLPDSKEDKITKEQVKSIILEELTAAPSCFKLEALEKASIRILNLFR